MDEARSVSKMRRYGAIAGIVLATAILAAIVGIWVLPGDEGVEDVASIHGDDRSLDQVTDLAYPAELLWDNPLDSASMPAEVALLDDRVFVLDTNNNRILELDDAGEVLQELDVQSDSRLALANPMAMTVH